MGIVDFVRILRRHVIAIAILMVAGGIAIGVVWQTAPVPYQSQSSMIVLRPNVQFDFENRLVPINPWQNLADPSAQVAASALASVANDEGFTDKLADLGVTSMTDVQVALDASGGAVGGIGIFLTLTAINDDPDVAQSDLSVLGEELTAELDQRQTEVGAPRDTLLTLELLTSPTEPLPIVTDRVTLAAVTGAFAFVVTVLLVAALELLYRRRRRPVSSDVRADEGVRMDEGERGGRRDKAEETAAAAASKVGKSEPAALGDARPNLPASRGGVRPRPRPSARAAPDGSLLSTKP